MLTTMMALMLAIVPRHRPHSAQSYSVLDSVLDEWLALLYLFLLTVGYRWKKAIRPIPLRDIR